MIRTFLIWLAFDVPYVPFRAWILGLAIGRMPHRVSDEELERLEAKQAEREQREFLDCFNRQIKALDKDNAS